MGKKSKHPIRFPGTATDDDYEEGEGCESDEGEFVDDPTIEDGGVLQNKAPHEKYC